MDSVALQEEAMPDPQASSRVFSPTPHSEAVYLRFGQLPPGGRSFRGDGEGATWEMGVSVYRGYRKPSGTYVLDIPKAHNGFDLLVVAFNFVLESRPVYVVSGTEVGQGRGGEPVLRDATEKAISLLYSVELPEWLGPQARKLDKEWNRQRRNSRRGDAEAEYSRLASSLRRRPGSLRNLLVLALEEAWYLIHPPPASLDAAERRRNLQTFDRMMGGDLSVRGGSMNRATRRKLKQGKRA